MFFLWKHGEHRKIVFVKVESGVIEIYENVHWSRRCYAISLMCIWNEILLGSQRTVNQTTSCQHTHSKNKCSTLERYGWVRIKIKHMFSCFITEINYAYSFKCLCTRDLIHTYSYTFFYYGHNTWVQMFYFLNIHM